MSDLTKGFFLALLLLILFIIAAEILFEVTI